MLLESTYLVILHKSNSFCCSSLRSFNTLLSLLLAAAAVSDEAADAAVPLLSLLPVLDDTAVVED